MTIDDDEIAASGAAPVTEKEWRSIRSAADKSHKMWVVVGPVHAVVVNYRAAVMVVAAVAAASSPAVKEFILAFLGVSP